MNDAYHHLHLHRQRKSQRGSRLGCSPSYGRVRRWGSYTSAKPIGFWQTASKWFSMNSRASRMCVMGDGGGGGGGGVLSMMGRSS